MAAGETSWTRADLVVCGTGHQGLAIRAGFAKMGVRINLFPVGSARHLVTILSGRKFTAPYLIRDTHGDNGRILLLELAPDVAASQPFEGYLCPTDLATFGHLPGRDQPRLHDERRASRAHSWTAAATRTSARTARRAATAASSFCCSTSTS